MALLCSSITISFQSVVLIDDTLEMEFEPRLSEYSRRIQEVGLVRADFAQAFDRGNVRHVFDFSRVKRFDNHYLALAEMISFPQTLPTGEGPATITVHDGSGGNLITWNLQNCVVRSSPGRAKYNTSMHNVTLIGGDMVAL